MGYVGSVSSACLAGQGHNIFGVDINAGKVDMINQGIAPVIEPMLAEKLQQAVQSGRLVATTDGAAALAQSEVAFIAVATPSSPTGEINPEFLYRVCEEIARALKNLNKKQIVVIRSSVLPHIFQHCAEIFEQQAPGLVILCVNPEFLREGSAIRDFENPPYTILGTDDAEAEAVLRDLYASLDASVYVLAPREALMVKYASNIFHAMKVAFTNEIGLICRAQQIDSGAVMSTFVADTQLNISPRYLQPGFAFGGSCLPKDTRAIAELGRSLAIDLPLLSSIIPSNDQIIDRAVALIQSHASAKIGLVGLSFKPNSDDLRESPLVELARRLVQTGKFRLDIYDPNVSRAMESEWGEELVERAFPGIGEMLNDDLASVLANNPTVVVGHAYPELEAMAGTIAAGTRIIDLANVAALRATDREYHSITR